MNNLSENLLEAIFNQWSSKFSIVEKPAGVGYAVFWTDSTGKENAVRAPSYKYLWSKVGHAKAAFRYSSEPSRIFMRLIGTYTTREEDQQIWDYIWTRLKIKRIGGNQSDIEKAVAYLKQTPPDVKSALDILEKV